MNADYWQGRRVFLTGHTGFKGSWLSLWLQQLGAQIYVADLVALYGGRLELGRSALGGLKVELQLPSTR